MAEDFLVLWKQMILGKIRYFAPVSAEKMIVLAETPKLEKTEIPKPKVISVDTTQVDIDHNGTLDFFEFTVMMNDKLVEEELEEQGPDWIEKKYWHEFWLKKRLEIPFFSVTFLVKGISSQNSSGF